MPIIQLPSGEKLQFDDHYTEQQIGEAVDHFVSNGAQQNQPLQQSDAQTNSSQPQNQFLNAKSSFPGVSDQQLQERLQKVANDAPERRRNAGLAVRGAAQGIGSTATLPYDLATLGINKATGSNIESGSNIVSEGLSAIGLPEPKTANERIVNSAIEGATSGRGLAKAIYQNGAKVPAVLKKLVSSNVAAETAAGAGAGLGSQAAGEIWDNPLVRLGGGLVGGAAVGGGVSSITKPKASKPEGDLLGDVAARGLDETNAFGTVREGLEKEAATQQKKIGELFKDAKEKGQKAYVAAQDLNNFANTLRSGVKNEIDLAGKDLINRTADNIEALSKEGLSASNINELQSIRRSASRISSKGNPESYAAGDLVRKIDDFFEKTPIQGDEKAAQLWKDAISTSRNYYRTFEDPKKIAQAIDGNQTLETVEKSFLGSGPVSSQKDLAKTYDETLKASPVEKAQETGFALRQSILNRMIKDAARSSDSAEGLSAARLSNSIRNLRRENQSIWEKYTPSEKQILTKLEDDLRKTSEGGIVNKVYNATEKILRRGIRSNVELPRTLKPKTILTVNDLLDLSSTRPVSQFVTGAIPSASQASKQNQEKKQQPKKSVPSRQSEEQNLATLSKQEQEKYPGFYSYINSNK